MLMFPVIKVPIDKVKPYPLNAKKHPNQQIELLAKQIASGFDQPIVVDKDYVIIKGHGRLLACKSLGMTEVPVIVRDDLHSDAVKATRIADNKLAETDWDLEVLAQDLESFESGIDLEEIGFSEDEIKELERLTEGFNDGFDEDEDEDEEVEGHTKELDPETFEFSHKCPKCGFEYDD